MERYGVEHNFQIESCKAKIRETNLKKYGATSPLGSKELREKGKLVSENMVLKIHRVVK